MAANIFFFTIAPFFIVLSKLMSAFWTGMYEYEVQSEKPFILTVPKKITYSFHKYVKPPI